MEIKSEDQNNQNLATHPKLNDNQNFSNKFKTTDSLTECRQMNQDEQKKQTMDYEKFTNGSNNSMNNYVSSESAQTDYNDLNKLSNIKLTDNTPIQSEVQSIATITLKEYLNPGVSNDNLNMLSKVKPSTLLTNVNSTQKPEIILLPPEQISSSMANLTDSNIEYKEPSQLLIKEKLNKSDPVRQNKVPEIVVSSYQPKEHCINSISTKFTLSPSVIDNSLPNEAESNNNETSCSSCGGINLQSVGGILKENLNSSSEMTSKSLEVETTSHYGLLKNKFKSLSNIDCSVSAYLDVWESFKNPLTKNFHRSSYSPEIKQFQNVNPAATLLVVPQSGAPAIFLKKDTPSTTPAESPVQNSSLTFEKSLIERSSSENCLESQLVDKSSYIEELQAFKKISEAEDVIEDLVRRSPSSFYNRMKKKVRRPMLQLPTPLKQLKEKEKDRRFSMMSTLSISQISRRPSLTSLLSVSPSLGGRRFSFNIGSRSDQMISVSYKSLESFVNENNLAGLAAFLASRSVVIDDRDENGASVLTLCASNGKADFCKELLNHGADVNAEDNDSWTPLMIAAKEGHFETVKTLIDHDAKIDHRDIGGWTALMWACYKGHIEVSKTLLDSGADCNAQGQHHMTSLVWAAGRGHTEIVQALLAKGAKVNMGDKFGTTPLIWACRKGYFEITEELINHNASVDAIGMYSWTALIMATQSNYIDIVNILLSNKPNVNALDKDGGTALTIACKEGYAEISSALLKAGAYVNIQDRNGDSNLIYASRGGHKKVVEALLKKHADIDCVGKDKKTALYWAVEKGHTQVVKLLLSANADLETCTKDGDTALLKAVRNKNAEVVQMFVDKKARVNVADKKGDTALHIAMRGRSKRIVEILLRNPKNSQMLYRPNRSGETPYNIDLSNQKTILGQIFGARRLNTNEENENMLGYDLYSSSMADILSEPSLSMPISVGLYARWGSGKSFLIRKLREEMNSFARQWVEPLFQFTGLVFAMIIITSFLVGFITLLATRLWFVGVATGGGLFMITTLLLIAVWYGSRSKYDWHLWYRWSVTLASQMASFRLIAQVIFCSPPGDQWKEWKDGVQAKPLKFIFAEGAKPSSTGAGGNSVIQILGSLFDMVEKQYGLFPTRFYRAFRPKANSSSSPWKYRRLCGVPYIAIFFVTLACSLTITYLAVTYGFHGLSNANVAEIGDKKLLERNKFIDIDKDVPRELSKRSLRYIDDDDDEDEDDDMDDEDELGNRSELDEDENGFGDRFGRPLHGRLINPLLFILSALVILVIVANISTLARMFKALIFSHKRHLLTAIAKFDTMHSEGYLPTLKNEVNLMVEMVRCLDSFTRQQTRLVVILDGLDSCEQEKVLSVLDAVHTLFTDSNGPFIILLAIDPHIISKAIELNATKVFRESSITGHDYLRNIIHLPFYLQNAGLRKVKMAEQAAEHLKGRTQSSWNEQETEFVSLATTSAMGGLHHMPVTRHMSSASELGYNVIPGNRRMSSESGLSIARRNTNKSSRRLKASDSVNSSIASNLNRVGAASDLNKVLLTDDYFNDINPRSMRRLMNVVYITGRLLKASHIEFNWYHLALWVNVTEQWPYRASWLIHFYEKKDEVAEEKMTLKDLYERAKSNMPTSKELEPLLEMDKDERKFETFLTMHENVLHVFNLIIFLPFTINLDPYIKKKIKEDQLQQNESYPRVSSPNILPPWHLSQPQVESQSRTSTLSWNPKVPPPNKGYGSLPPAMNPLMWGYGAPYANNPPPNFNPPQTNISVLSLPTEAHDKKLSIMSIQEIFELLEKVDGVSKNNLPSYGERLKENNINGKVLFHCNIEDLKQIVKMNFGDWELFKMLVLGLRDQEINGDDDILPRNFRFPSTTQSDTMSNHHPLESMSSDVSDNSLIHDGQTFKRGSVRSSHPVKEEVVNRRPPKHSLHAKQITLEEQMIFGALQTLNEEAYEDVLDEQAKNDSITSAYFLGEPYGEENFSCSTDLGHSSSNLSVGRAANNDEIDVVYLQSSPLMGHTVFSCSADLESTAPSVASSFSPYRGSISLSRASSMRGSSANVSPKHSTTEKNYSHHKADRTISLESPTLVSSQSNFSDRRERPQSLNLDGDQSLKMTSNGVSQDTTPLNGNGLEGFVDASEFSSLQDILEKQSGHRRLSLSEQITASSSSSIEKLRKLSKKLHKALGVQDENQFTEDEKSDASPLVLTTPSSETYIGPAGSAVSPSINGDVSPSEHDKLMTRSSEETKSSRTHKVSFEIDKETNF